MNTLTEALKSISDEFVYEVVCSAYELKTNGDPYATVRFSQLFGNKEEVEEVLKMGNLLSMKTYGSWLKTSKDNLRNSVLKYLDENGDNCDDNDITKTVTLLSLVNDGRFCWFGNYKINSIKIKELTIHEFIKVMETGKSDTKESDMWVALR